MRILVIEDDPGTADYLTTGLRDSGYKVEHSAHGSEGLVRASQQRFDLLIVDRMLPGLEGLSVIRALRARGVDTPVLILSALAQIDDRVRGLRAGGDDYITKPYAFAELLARVEALLRRGAEPAATTRLRVADLEMDLLERSVRRAGQAIELQPRELALLAYLMRHAGQIVTRSMLLEGVWGYRFDPHTNLIDVHVSRLRQKIDRGFDAPLLHTVRGAGYTLGTRE